MSTHKAIEKICCVTVAFSLILTVLFMNAGYIGIAEASNVKEYGDRLFDASLVHTIDIEMDDWETFINNCRNEEYALCSVIIDNEAYNNVAIRAKGNTSLTQVESYGNNRYSFKIEFDHYDSTMNYYGLDKISLNNIIQDNTYMKDFVVYQMMKLFGADAPLCSYVNIKVNGENWGLYLAVESIEEAFLERNYGSDYGELYKPDSVSMNSSPENGIALHTSENGDFFNQGENQGMQPPDVERLNKGKAGGSMGSSAAALIYSDDKYDSYKNIFDNEKTDITDAHKDRMIQALKQLNNCENIEKAVNVDAVIRYFVVHNFVCNFDSYTGSMIHNYYLYEENGQLSMIPWDYNLAFGGFGDAGEATELCKLQ